MKTHASVNGVETFCGLRLGDPRFHRTLSARPTCLRCAKHMPHVLPGVRLIEGIR